MFSASLGTTGTMGVTLRAWSIVAWTLVGGAGLVHLVMAHELPGGPDGMSDLGVYRLAAHSVLVGEDPYQIASPYNGDRFVYPPFAPLALVPLAVLPEPAARLVWTAGQWLPVVLLAIVVGRSASTPVVRRLPRQLGTPVLAGLLLLSYPVFTGLFLGQISLLITELMLVDALDLLPRPVRGLCWGLPAGLKLTALVLLPWLWWTGRRRAALVGLGTFATTIAIGWWLLPDPSAAFWPTATAVPDFVQLSQLDNQSLRGFLARAGWSSPARAPLVVALAVLALIAYRGACDLHRQGRALEAAIVVGALAVLVSPISWSHHQTVLGARRLLRGHLRPPTRTGLVVGGLPDHGPALAVPAARRLVGEPGARRAPTAAGADDRGPAGRVLVATRRRPIPYAGGGDPTA